jgi:hypothetical protein
MKNFTQNAVAAILQLGKLGAKLKSNSGVIEARNAADNAFAKVRGADPAGMDDLVTLRYLKTQASATVTGQIDGGTPPAVVDGAVYIATTTGGTYTAGRLYYGESSAWNERTPGEGMTIVATDALAGGTLTFAADHLYAWDADASTWDDIGPTPATTETKLLKVVKATINFDTSTPVNLGSALPVGASVSKFIVDVTTEYDQPSTVVFGISGSTSELGLAIESNLNAIDTYIIDRYKTYSGGEQIIATLDVGVGATAGAATVEMHYSIV